MRDGFVRRIVKWFARLASSVDLAVTRALQPPPRYRLTGTCNGCGKCCEHPSILVSRAVFRRKWLLEVLISWHRVVNGFELETIDPRLRMLSFSCTHYDRATKRCDSYESRPLMCRDYPLNLTFEAVPQLFDECSHRIVDRHAEGLKAALDQTSLTADQRKALEEKLYLSESSTAERSKKS